MGLVQNYIYHSVKVITPRKTYIFEQINLLWNTWYLDKKNDVMHNIFRCCIPLI